MRNANNLVCGRADDRAAQHSQSIDRVHRSVDRPRSSNGHPLEMNHTKRARGPGLGSDVSLAVDCVLISANAVSGPRRPLVRLR